MPQKGFSILVLAAGKATRFKSEHSKMLHRLAGRPLGEYGLQAAFAAHPERVYVVTGHEADEVRKTFARPGLTFIEQKKQLGTGHAVMVARPELERCPSPTLVVLVGDAPLLRPETLVGLVEVHTKARAACTVLTTRLENPTGYGRIVRAAGARVRAIVEEKVATPAQRKIAEINSGILCFSREKLLAHLDELSADNAQKEYLLTDLVEIFNRRRLTVSAFRVADSREVLGVNDRVELAGMEKVLRLRKAEALMREGVTIVNPEVTTIDAEVEVGRDTVIDPGVSLLGRTRVGSGSWLQPYAILTNAVLGDRVTVRPFSVITGSEVGSDVVVGPFAHVRDGAVIEAGARIGNFVELKKSRIGKGAKALHLTYLGDATIGERANIGAGTITCNYDGEKKNPTFIEDEVFIGSGNMLVAPVRIGKGSYTAAGSTITQDVPPGSLAIGRALQVVKEGWVQQRKQAKRPRTVTLREAGSATVLEVRGRLVLGEATAQFHAKVREPLRTAQKLLVVNLSKLEDIDSAGMGELVGALTTVRTSGGRLRLSNLPPTVLQRLKATNLHRVFEIYSDESAAIAGLGVSLKETP